MKPVVLKGLVPAAGMDSLSAERCVEAFNGARANGPNGPVLPGSVRGPHSQTVNFIHRWLTELGLTTA